MNKVLMLIVFCFCSFSVMSQNLIDGDVDAGNDVAVDCTTPCTDLSATFTPTFDTSAGLYEVQSIPYDPQVLTTTTSIDEDDEFSTIIDLPFTFCYFGDQHSQIVIGDNGNISFDTTLAGQPDPFSFSESCPDPNLPSGGIFGAYHDLDIRDGGSIKYGVTGTAPFRAFVIWYEDVAQYSCSTLITSQQIALHESSNFIDVYIGDKPTCTSWNSGNAVIGIQNIGGTQGYAAPGRNTSDSPWTVTNEAWRFAPSSVGAAPVFTFDWRDAAGNILSTANPFTVCPSSATTYTAHVEYIDCLGNVSIAEDEVIISANNSATSNIIPHMEQCDLDLSGGEVFDLTSNDALQPVGEIVTYYDSAINAQAGTATGLLLPSNAFPITIAQSPFPVYARIVNPADGCYVMEQFNLVTEAAPKAGSDGTLQICEGETALQDIYTILGIPVTAGGVWTDVDGAGVNLTDATQIDFSAITDGVYDFEYSFAAAFCPADSATITVTINNLLVSGTDGAIEFCEGETTTQNLFGALTSSPDTGGVWADVDGAGVNLTDATTVDFSGVTDGVYNFQYSFPINGLCPASQAIVEVTITNLPTAGTDGTIEFCEGETTLQNLFTELTTADIGGVWTDVDGAGVNLTDATQVDFSAITDGVYNFEYSFAASGSCPVVASNVAVTISNLLVSGGDGAITLCETDTTLQNLNAAITGPFDLGGTWVDVDGLGVDLTDTTQVDFSGVTDGVYTFNYSFPTNGSCPASEAIITVTIENIANAGINGVLEFCEGEIGLQNLYNALGTPDLGGFWTDIDGTGVNLADATQVDFSTITDGIYNFTYTFPATITCPIVEVNAEVTITNLVTAGLDGVIEFCEGETATQNLFTALNGTPDTGGIWSDVNTTGVDLTDPTQVDFSTLPNGVYAFDYSFVAIGSCPIVKSTVEVTVTNLFSPGISNTITLCEGETDVQSLFNALGTTADTGGVWNDLNASGVNISDINNIDFSGLGVGSYDFEYVFATLGSCPSSNAVITVSITQAPQAPVIPIDTLTYCDTDNDDVGYFDLSSIVANLSGNGLYDVTFYETVAEANAQQGAIDPNVLYENIDSNADQDNNPATQTLFAQVSQPGIVCYILVPVKLHVINSPELPSNELVYAQCEDVDDPATDPFNESLDGFMIFDLVSYELTNLYTEIINAGGDPLEYTTSYYHSDLSGNIDYTNPIFTPNAYQNTSSPDQLIYVVVEHTGSVSVAATGCSTIKAITLHVDLLPVAIYTPIEVCDDNDVNSLPPNNTSDGIIEFDLTGYIGDITGGATGVAVEFYTTAIAAEAGLGAATVPSTDFIAMPTAYENEFNPQAIFARVYNPTTTCHAVAIVRLHVNPNPTPLSTSEIETTLGNGGIMEECDGNVDGSGDISEQIATFDLTLWETVILNGESGVSAVYYANADDAAAGANTIQNPASYNNISNPQTIYVSVVNDGFGINPVTAGTGCNTVVTFQLFVPVPTVEVTPSKTVICVDANGVPLTDTTLPVLTANALPLAPYDYQWMLNGVTIPGATNSIFTVTEPGDYTVVVSGPTDFDCINISSAVTIEVSGVPDGFDANVTTNAFAESHQIVAVATSSIPGIEFWYSLDDGEPTTNGTFEGVSPGTHVVTITDGKNCWTENVDVTLIDYPHFFTPNGDGVNDTWRIIGQEGIPISQIYIFDRFGKLLSQLDPDGEGWDGTYNGSQMPASDYWFKILYIEGADSSQKEFKAHFSLKR